MTTVPHSSSGMDLKLMYQDCTLCPRMCHADRTSKTGFCRCTDEITAARAALHFWEEPCQISQEGVGKTISTEELARIFLELQGQGAENISLVTADQYLPSVLAALDQVKDQIRVPVVYNCSGYERLEILQLLSGSVDIYLPDLKYYDSGIAQTYSRAGNYFSYASKAIPEMIRQTGPPRFNDQGVLEKGVIVRHMVLPGQRKDSIRLLHWMADHLEKGSFLLSLMSQYTPFYHASDYPEINRRITTYEYEKVLDEAVRLGLTDGYMQEKSSAKEEYTPAFDLEGIERRI